MSIVMRYVFVMMLGICSAAVLAQSPNTSKIDRIEILGSGSIGEGSLLTVTTPAPGGQPYTLAERSGDEVSIMSFIPAHLRASVRAGTNTVDLTKHIRAALATGKSVRFAAGRYLITDTLHLASGQRLTGDGPTVAVLMVDASFNMSAPAVVSVATGDSSGWDGLGIEFDQSGATSRATLYRYPWALDIRTATRFKVGTLRLSRAWNGIRGDGNCGGFNADLLEIGAFNKGLLFDGLLDFAHIGSLHLWPFGIAGNPTLIAVHRDGATIGADFGRVDGLDIKSLNSFGSSIISSANGNTGAARQIGMMQLDGDGTDFINTAGDWQLGLVSITRSGGATTTSPAIEVVNGTVVVSSLRLSGATQSPTVRVTGGTVAILGGSFEQLRTDYPAAEVSGGILAISGARLAPIEGGDRNTGFLRQTGSGVLKARNNMATTGGSGPLISVAADLAGHTIVGNDFNGFGFALPPGAKFGEYGPNKVTPFTWNPTPSFSKHRGSFAASFNIRQGWYAYDTGRVNYWFRLHFSHNAFSGASGDFIVTGLPFNSSIIDMYPGAIGEFGGFTTTARTMGLASFVSANSSEPGIYFLQHTPNGTINLPASAVPTTSGSRYISATGSIPLR